MIYQSADFVLDELPNQCLLFVNSKKAPSADEYAHVLDLYRRRRADLGSYRCLVITDGAAPSAQQRKQQQQEFGDVIKSIPTAVVSDAITVRFVVSSAALFVKTIKAFDIGEFPSALGFLSFTDAQKEEVSARLNAIPAGQFRALDGVLGR